jgi:hypothetical protein
MKYLTTALAVAVGALALAAGAFGATGSSPLGAETLKSEHAALHLEQVGPKYLTLERAETLKSEHAALHLEQVGPKYLGS